MSVIRSIAVHSLGRQLRGKIATGFYQFTCQHGLVQNDSRLWAFTEIQNAGPGGCHHVCEASMLRRYQDRRPVVHEAVGLFKWDRFKMSGYQDADSIEWWRRLLIYAVLGT